MSYRTTHLPTHDQGVAEGVCIDGLNAPKRCSQGIRDPINFFARVSLEIKSKTRQGKE
jgi:hypothetical protein